MQVCRRAVIGSSESWHNKQKRTFNFTGGPMQWLSQNWICDLDRARNAVVFAAGHSDNRVKLPGEPMLGTVGVAPAGYEVHLSLVLARIRGSMDALSSARARAYRTKSSETLIRCPFRSATTEPDHSTMVGQLRRRISNEDSSDRVTHPTRLMVCDSGCPTRPGP